MNAGSQTVGKVLAIALRCPDQSQMTEVPQAAAIADGGLQGDVASRPERGVTFISSRQWKAVTDQLGSALPWWTRRANVLVEAESLASLIGRRIRVGSAEVQINAETKPCELMDRLCPGLRAALTPECRGGVYGRVISAGTFRVGDMVQQVGT